MFVFNYKNMCARIAFFHLLPCHISFLTSTSDLKSPHRTAKSTTMDHGDAQGQSTKSQPPFRRFATKKPKTFEGGSLVPQVSPTPLKDTGTHVQSGMFFRY